MPTVETPHRERDENRWQDSGCERYASDRRSTVKPRFRIPDKAFKIGSRGPIFIRGVTMHHGAK